MGISYVFRFGSSGFNCRTVHASDIVDDSTVALDPISACRLKGGLIMQPQQPTNQQQHHQLIYKTLCPDASREEFDTLMYQAERTGLDPLNRHIYMLKRGGRYMASISIDGARMLADKTGKYRGQTPPEWCGPDGVWVQAWLDDKPPSAARVGVLRADFDAPVYAVANFRAYNASSPIWRKMPELMLSKCAEMLAIRKAFPAALSGLYAPEELEADTEALEQAKEQRLAAVAAEQGKHSQGHFQGHQGHQHQQDTDAIAEDAKKALSVYAQKVYGKDWKMDMRRIAENLGPKPVRQGDPAYLDYLGALRSEIARDVAANQPDQDPEPGSDFDIGSDVGM